MNVESSTPGVVFFVCGQSQGESNGAILGAWSVTDENGTGFGHNYIL